MDERRKVPKGTAVVEYESRDHATKAIAAMDGAQIDGSLIIVRFLAAPVELRRASPNRRDDR